MRTVIIIPDDPGREIYQASHPERASDRDSLAFLYRHIGCSTVDVVNLNTGVDMWLDDNGAFTRPVNDRATALARSLNPRSQAFYGTVVITGYNPGSGSTRNLKDSERDWVIGQIERALALAS